MKKFCAMALAFIMVVAFGAENVSAAVEPQNAQTQVEYTFEVAGSYVVDVPATINAGQEFNVSLASYDINVDYKTINVRVTNLNDYGWIKLMDVNGNEMWISVYGSAYGEEQALTADNNLVMSAGAGDVGTAHAIRTAVATLPSEEGTYTGTIDFYITVD